MPEAELAETLGVTESVLKEALALRRAAALKRGRAPKRLGKRSHGRADYAVVKIVLPVTVYVDWKEYLRVLRVSGAALLRSLLHRALLSGVKPASAGAHWMYQGKRHMGEGQRVTEMAETRVTRGLMAALDHQSAHWNMPPSHIVRGVILDFLEGRTKKLQIVAFRELWGDPERYLHPESFRGQ